MSRDECLLRIANMPVFKSKKFDPTQHPNWKFLADQEGDEWWWDLEGFPNQPEQLDLTGHHIRDLSLETDLMRSA